MDLSKVGFNAGNQWAKAENLTVDANKKRFAGLIKSWETIQRKLNGEEIVSMKTMVHKIRRKRARLRLTVAKEHREIQEKARTAASAVMDRLIEIAQTSTMESMAIQAAQVVLDRAYGKSIQTSVSASADGKKTSEITGKQLDERYQQVLERVESLTRGAGKEAKSEKRPVDLREHNRNPDRSKLN